MATVLQTQPENELQNSSLVDRLMVLLLQQRSTTPQKLETDFSVTQEAMQHIRADYEAGKTVTVVWAEYFRSQSQPPPAPTRGTRTCPYYIVHNEEELARVRKALNGYSGERLYPFPFIIGKEPGMIFQAPGSAHPLETDEGAEGEPDYVYQLIALPT